MWGGRTSNTWDGTEVKPTLCALQRTDQSESVSRRDTGCREAWDQQAAAIFFPKGLSRTGPIGGSCLEAAITLSVIKNECSHHEKGRAPV